jgi:hypothetical protein
LANAKGYRSFLLPNLKPKRGVISKEVTKVNEATIGKNNMDFIVLVGAV